MAGAKGAIAKVFSHDTSMLILRLLVGAVYLNHGGQKMFGWFGGKGWNVTIDEWAKNNHMPYPLAAAAIVTEFVGACCILAGVLTRFWSAGQAILMLVAIFYVHMHLKGDSIGSLEFQFSLLAASLALYFGGPGRWAIGDIEGWMLGLNRSGE